MDLLLRREPFERVAAWALREAQVIHAPHLLDVEVVQALRRLEAAGAIDARRGREALEDLNLLRLVRHPHAPLLDRMWAMRHNLTAYDALYVALAEVLDAPLVTTDRRLASAPGHDARVEVCA